MCAYVCVCKTCKVICHSICNKKQIVILQDLWEKLFVIVFEKIGSLLNYDSEETGLENFFIHVWKRKIQILMLKRILIQNSLELLILLSSHMLVLGDPVGLQYPLLVVSVSIWRFLCRFTLEFSHCVSGTVIHGCVLSLQTVQF